MASRDEKGDIAVVGMACRMAGANSPSELWDILANSKDVQSVITRFNTEGFYHPQGGPRKGSTNVQHAYTMDDEAIDKFDHAFFHITPVEAVAIDPQQRMLLEVAYEAIENAGIPLEDFMGTDTCVMAGVESCDYHDIISRDIDATPRYLATGTPMCMAANRLSYFFNLSGPSIAMDTACSSTMAALHQAVRALQHGDSGLALVCGAKLIITPNMFVPSTELGFLSPSGRSRSFDADADGYGRGEGVVALLLKPLTTALLDGDPVRAVIKGTRLNQDGRTKGITLPSASAQRDNMDKLYSELGIYPGDIQYLEAHGTGTAGGDRLEFSAINAVFGHADRRRPLVVGALKSCVGHLEACSGLASVVKTIECLERGKIPPQMHLKKLNPQIDFRGFVIPRTTLEWPASPGQTRRAAVNTFGAGGTNAHAVLESHEPRVSRALLTRKTYLFMVSAADEHALSQLSLKYADYVERFKPILPDLAHTLLARRSMLGKSMFFAAGSHDEAASRLRSQTAQTKITQKKSTRAVVFLFTGQGAQWPAMGKALIEESPLFQAVLLKCDLVLASLPDPPSWSVVDEMKKAPDVTNVYKSLYSQPLCTALQLGIVFLLRSWGISPTSVVGHSSGEIAAAYTAGLLSFDDAIIAAYYRGVFLRSTTLDAGQKLKGSMCAVGMSQSDALQLLTKYSDRVQLAAVNSPNSCTLSGDADVIREIEKDCVEQAVFCRSLRIDMAYHSHHVVPGALAYERALEAANVPHDTQHHSCDMFSSVTGKKMQIRETSPRYWKDNMTSTVQFCSAFTDCLRNQSDDFVILEIGPHPALKGPAKEILQCEKMTNTNYFHSLFRHKNDMEALLGSIGDMIATGVSVDKPKINAKEIVDGIQCRYECAAVLKDLPSYQWDHSTSLWYEARSSRNQRFRRFPRHAMLGSRYLEDSPLNASWRSLLKLEEVPWLAALKSKGATYMPTTAFILMVAEAARQIFVAAERSGGSIDISDMDFDNPPPLSLFGTTPNIEFHLTTQPAEQANEFTFGIHYLLPGQKDSSERVCSGSFRWIQSLNQETDYIIQQSTRDHDPWLLELSQTLADDLSSKLLDLKLNFTGSSGTFEHSSNPFDHYYMDPEILHSILQIASRSTLQRSLPSVPRIRSISSLTLPFAEGRKHTRGRFTLDIQPAYSDVIRANASISFGGNDNISISDICSTHGRAIDQTPAPRSLFFKPVMLPDITKIEPAREPKYLTEILRLVTHKWPMSDIAIIGMTEKDVNTILRSFESADSGGRPRFRSITVVGDSKHQSPSSIIQFADKLASDRQYHFVFQGSADIDAEEACRLLLPSGLLCVRNVAKRHDDFSELLVKLFDITGLGDQFAWNIWRRRKSGHVDRKSAPHSRLTLFSTNGLLSAFGEAFPGAERVQLDPTAMKAFTEGNTALSGKRHAIIIDSVENPIITTWRGQDLVPWFQILLESYEKIVWVAPDSRNDTPHHGVAGNLLRSLQAEQPSLRIAWLKFEDVTVAKMQEIVKSTYQSLHSGYGENEVLLQVGKSDSQILRYLPDDELSISTGVALPRSAVKSDLEGKSYEVSLTATDPIVLVCNKDSRRPLNTGEVRVKIEASVIDTSDVLPPKRKTGLGSQPLPCRFFAGLVADPGQGDFATGSRVVGWYQGPHCGEVDVSKARLHGSSDTVPPAHCAAEFACLSAALSTVDGAARAREGDLFYIRLCGPIGEAMAKVCRKFGAETIRSSRAATFTVNVASERGFLVNNRLVDVEEYLTSCRGVDMLRRYWKDRTIHAVPCKIVKLTEIGKGILRLGPEDIYSTVLDHSEKVEARGVRVKHKSGALFTSDGTYVLIGGFGGLGRFICSWMVENGAARLCVISRSGLQSQEARDTHAAVKNSHASLDVIKADASDRVAMQSALAQIRKTSPIKGVLNLAIVLEDSQFASMTGEQWDRAVGLKRDSSWILHEETLNDKLDFFILLSSIASVLGNRGQGNYNIGNTFLNSLASYRRSVGLTAVSVALGAMTEIGVLHDLGKKDLVETLTRSGLSPLGTKELAKIMEAAVLESRHSDHSLILTGLEMFDRVDGHLVGSRDQMQLFWTELPEFGFLQNHKLGNTETRPDDQKLSLRDRALGLSDGEAQTAIQKAFIEFLSQLLGFDTGKLEPTSSLAAYGLDSLSAVSCQYWLHRNLSVNIPLTKIFDAPSIDHLVKEILKEIGAHNSSSETA